MSCDVGEVAERLENGLILVPFHLFAYVTAHSAILPLLHLRHSSFSNAFASTLQALHLRHLASRPCTELKLYCVSTLLENLCDTSKSPTVTSRVCLSNAFKQIPQWYYVYVIFSLHIIVHIYKWSTWKPVFIDSEWTHAAALVSKCTLWALLINSTGASVVCLCLYSWNIFLLTVAISLHFFLRLLYERLDCL